MVADEVTTEKTPESTPQRRSKQWYYWLLLPVWTYGAFLVAQVLVGVMLGILQSVGTPLHVVPPLLLVLVTAAVAYSLAVVLVIGVPYRLYERVTTWRELGLSGRLAWQDIGLAPLAIGGYMILTAITMIIVTQLFPVDVTQPQTLPFTRDAVVEQWQYIVAGLMLVVIAPIAEELLFRGYLFGKLRAMSPAWLAVVLTSLAFGLAHLWVGSGPLQWAVAIDTAMLSVVMCMTREYTGAIWTSILIHMIKNGLAFYLLFINPTLIEQLKAASALL